MYKHFALFLIVFSIPAYAGTTDSFFDWITQPFYDIWYAITVSFPALITRATAYFVEYSVYIKFVVMLESMSFAYQVAAEIMADLNIAGYLSSAVDGLPSNVKAIMTMWGITNCLNMIIHTWLTAFVMDFMGW